MIGFLCNSEDITNYCTCYYDIFKPIIDKNISIVFFTINNVDLKNRKVRGIIASRSGIKRGELQVPNIVFNFSNQCKKANIKKLKLLCELNELKIINETNKFNQIMIMQILSSFDSTKKYILHYNKLTEKEISVNQAAEQSFLVMPKVGSSFNKMIYIEHLNPNLKVNLSDYEEKQVQSKIITPSNKSLIMNCPKLKLCGNRLSVVRIFLQKTSKNMWKYLYSLTNLSRYIASEGIINNLKTISMEAINYINNYIPSLGICFIDFVFDENMNPYFLHLGGLDKNLLYKKEDEVLNKKFSENLIQYYKYYSSEWQED